MITKAVARLALKALDALPEKRLTFGEYESPNGDCCTMGAVCRLISVPAAENPDAKFEEQEYLDKIVSITRRSRDRIIDDVSTIVMENDAVIREETPEQRYIRMHTMLSEIVGK